MKGPDRAMVSADVADNDAPSVRNEIKEYEDLCSMGSSEGCYKIFAFPIAENKPAVQVLRIHLKDQQHVVFDEGGMKIMLLTREGRQN